MQPNSTLFGSILCSEVSDRPESMLTCWKTPFVPIGMIFIEGTRQSRHSPQTLNIPKLRSYWRYVVSSQVIL